MTHSTKPYEVGYLSFDDKAADLLYEVVNCRYELLPAEALEDIFSIGFDDRKLFLGIGAVRFPTIPDVAAKQILSSGSLQPRDNYVVCIVGGRHELFPQSHAELRSATPNDLQAVAVKMLEGWPEQARQFVAVGESESFFVVGMYTSVPGPLSCRRHLGSHGSNFFELKNPRCSLPRVRFHHERFGLNGSKAANQLVAVVQDYCNPLSGRQFC